MVDRHSNKRTYIILLIMALLVAGGLLAYYFYKNQDPTKYYKPMYDTSTNTDPQQSSEETVKENPRQSDLPTTSEDVPAATSGSINIVDLNQADGFVNAKAEVGNFATSTCVYQFTSEGARPVTRELQGQCDGISIPQAEFEKIGNYTLVVTAYSNDQKLSSTPQIINIR